MIDEATLTKVVELLLAGEQVEGFTFVPTKKVELNQNVTGLTSEGSPEGKTLCITGVRVAKKKIEADNTHRAKAKAYMDKRTHKNSKIHNL